MSWKNLDPKEIFNFLSILTIPIWLWISIGNDFFSWPTSISDFLKQIIFHFFNYLIILMGLLGLSVFLFFIIYILQLIWKDIKGKINWDK